MLWRRLRTLGRAEDGFTMITVIIGTAVALVFSVSAMAAVIGDLPVAKNDQSSKRAYDAAQAGIAWYRFQLTRDPSYWTRCTNVPAVATGVPAPVNQVWGGGVADPRISRALGDDGVARYTLELVPADGRPSCDPTNPSVSMLQDKTLRIRSTGFAGGKKRSILATFKRRSFLDFLYYSTYETVDPVTYSQYDNQDPGVRTWAGTACAKSYSAGRGSQSYTLPSGNVVKCGEIQWVTGDAVNGPLHTEDQLLVCGAPTFGRLGDRIEILDPAGGGVRSGGCGGAANFVGQKVSPADGLPLPPSNQGLKDLAAPAYTFTGATRLVFNGTSMTVENNGTTTSLALPPPNGVIWVKSGTCGREYQYYQRYDDPAGCGNVRVSGTYSTNTTIGSDNDIIVDGNLTRSGDSLMGLIAAKFVRVYHPVAMNLANATQCNSSASNAAGSMASVQIDAAIFALQDSFIVDNYFCGSALGTLNVYGSISQKFRGPVGTSSSGTAVSGYIKNYRYDDRLAYKEPPNFIDPVQASWRLVRSTEFTPAR